MSFTKEQRLDIGRRVYNQELSHTEASIQYGIALTSVNRYVHDYKVSIGVSTEQRISGKNKASSVKQPDTSSIDIEAYRAMSKDELIDELIRAKVNEARAKKGYEVKGVGAGKEYISLSSRNLKS